MGSLGGGGGRQHSKSEVVGWERLLHPQQKMAIKAAGPGLTTAGVQGLQGFGLSPQERSRQKAGLAGDISDMAAGMRESIRSRAGTYGQKGGVVEGAMKNIDAARLIAYGEGLRDIEEMNQQRAQQKVANLLSFLTWSPPAAQKSESSGWDMNTRASFLTG